jgi:GntR family transcriptional repressor for pyruvate dehydrogenase complex
LVLEIRHHIMSGEWPAGSKIPTERQLCERFEVSRSVVREAISALVCLGILRTRQGGGVFVCVERDSSWIEALVPVLPAGPRMLAELMTLRKAIEPVAAGLAATRADQQALTAIRAAHDAMTRSNSVSERISAGLAFHHAIARGSGNDLLTRLLTNLIDLFAASHRITLESETGKHEGLVDHAGILHAITSGDAELAQREMLIHLLKTERLLPAIDAAATNAIAPLPAIQPTSE